MNGKSQESGSINYPDLSSSTTAPPPPTQPSSSVYPPPPPPTQPSTSVYPPPPPPTQPSSSVYPPPSPYGQPHHQPGPSSGAANENAEKWGAHVMGTPAVPTCHPNNQKAALWGVADQKDYQNHHQPYIQYAPIDKNNTSPIGSVLHKVNTWSAKAESTAHNIWHHLKTGESVCGAAWGKVNLRVKTITGGGFEALYKQGFATYPNETLKKTFACYLSTSTGPVAGTLYLSNAHVAFCSDRPLSFTAPSGQQTWSYYKIMIPLAKIASTNPVIMRESPKERYIQLVSVDGHDFWFMGFVNYEKATQHLFETISSSATAGVPVPPPVAAQLPVLPPTVPPPVATQPPVPPPVAAQPPVPPLAVPPPIAAQPPVLPPTVPPPVATQHPVPPPVAAQPVVPPLVAAQPPVLPPTVPPPVAAQHPMPPPVVPSPRP